MRGFVSFLVFSFAALLILLPYYPHPAAPSLASAYENEVLYLSTTSLGRALSDSAAETAAKCAKELQAAASATGQSGAGAVSSPTGQSEESEVCKQQIISQWESLISDWNSNQNLPSSARIFCGVFDEKNNTTTPATPIPLPLSFCLPYLEYESRPQPINPAVRAARPFPFAENGGIWTITTLKNTNASAQFRFPDNFELTARR